MINQCKRTPLPILRIFLFASQLTVLGISQVAAAGPLVKTWEAHGGLERWRTQRTLHYVMHDFPLSAQVAKPNKSTVDLRNRSNRIEGVGFIVGFDGEEAWSKPGPDAVGLPPRFFALGSFYFIGMPFVFADPGVVLEDRGMAVFRDKEYRVVAAGYETGIGHTSKDDYILYIDPDTDLLQLIHHSVTEPSNKVERVTWVFDEWQSVSGLTVPLRITFYGGWNEGVVPEPGAQCTILGVTFRTTPPDPAIFARPVDGVVDDSPLY